MQENARYDCPLCGTDFTGAECHTACVFAKGCNMVRCPHCGYEFVESGRFADMLRRWIRRAPRQMLRGTVVRLTELPPGSSAVVAHIAAASATRLSRLASYGIQAGTEVRLLARRPAVVVECGASSVALEDEIGNEIYVRT